MNIWLLEAEARRIIIEARKQWCIEQQNKFLASRYDAVGSDSGPRILTIAGDQAQINVVGILTKTPDYMAMYYGGGNTTYGEIIDAISAMNSDSSVKEGTMVIDSPGGLLDGLYEAIRAVSNSEKPINVVVTGQCCSAAYAIACQGKKITAINPLVRVGSVGIVAEFDIDPDKVKMTSTGAPAKAPDVTTAEGKAVVQTELDAMHEVFIGAIASGRGISSEDVQKNYGKGATLLANDALKAGMIDAVEVTALKDTKTSRVGGAKQEEKVMNLSELKAQHADVYAAAKAEGVVEERDRACSHLIMGEASGDMVTAVRAVKEGTAMTATLNATYMAAAMNRKSVGDRQTDDKAAAEGADGAAGEKPEAKAAAESEAVVAAVEAYFGIDSKKVSA